MNDYPWRDWPPANEAERKQLREDMDRCLKRTLEELDRFFAIIPGAPQGDKQ